MTQHEGVRTRALVIATSLGVLALIAAPDAAPGQCGSWTYGSSISTACPTVGVGTTTPSAPFHLFRSNMAQLKIQSGGPNDTSIDFTDTVRRWILGINVGGFGQGNFHLFDATSYITRLTIDVNGNVGIGTPAPLGRLDVGRGGGDIYLGYNFTGTNQLLKTFVTPHAPGNVPSQLNVGINDGSFAGMVIKDVRDGTLNSQSLEFHTHHGGVSVGPRLTIDKSGNVAVTGNLSVGGNIAAKYQDLAEWVPASRSLAAGTVVVLDTARGNAVKAGSSAYDTRVAGVVSAQPGIVLGEAGEDKLLIATTGRVRVRVEANRGPISVGDLLVTSDLEGFAMRSEPLVVQGFPMHRPGTLIGKALEALPAGEGEVLVLLSLQ